MPQIKEYVNRSEVGAQIGGRRADPDAFGAVGKGAAMLGGAMSDVGDMLQKRAEQQELSDLNAKMSQVDVELNKEWQETLRTATPGDTTLVEKFNEKYDERMGKLREGVSTRAGEMYFSKANADLKQHYLKSAMANQTELAGVKAKMDAQTTLSNYTSTLYSDPSSFELKRTMYRDSVEGLVASGLTSRANADMILKSGEAELAKSAARGWVKLDPEGTQNDLRSGKWDAFIDGGTKRQIFAEADTEMRGRELDIQRREKEKERALEEKNKSVQNKFLALAVERKLSPKDILNSDLPAFGSGSKNQFLDMVKADNENRAMKTDGAVFSSLFQKIHNGELTDPNDLNKFVGNGLTFGDLNNLRGEVEGLSNSPEGKAAGSMKKQLVDMATAKLVRKNPTLGLQDPDGEESLLKYQSLIYQKESEQRKAGKPIIDLYRPESPDYVGKYLGQFTKTPKQLIKSMTQINNQPSANAPTGITEPAAPNPNARKPGESIADWRKRTKGN